MNFVNLHVDAEKGEGPDLAKKYHIRGYPTTIFADSKGEEIDRLIGYLPARDYLKVMQDYHKGVNTLSSFLKDISQNPDDVDLRYKIIEKYYDRGDFEEVEKHASIFIQKDPDNKSGKLASAELYRAEAIAFTRDDPSELKAYIAKYNENDAADKGLRSLQRYYRRKKDVTNELSVLRQIVDRHPNDPNTLNSFAWRTTQLETALDEGLKYIEKAIALLPDSLAEKKAGIIDTKAEVLWKMGRTDEAIKTIKKAILLQPEDKYFQDQLAKFEGKNQ